MTHIENVLTGALAFKNTITFMNGVLVRAPFFGNSTVHIGRVPFRTIVYSKDRVCHKPKFGQIRNGLKAIGLLTMVLLNGAYSRLCTNQIVDQPVNKLVHKILIYAPGDKKLHISFLIAEYRTYLSKYP